MDNPKFITWSLIRRMASDRRHAFKRRWGCDIHSEESRELGGDPHNGGEHYDDAITTSDSFESLMKLQKYAKEIPFTTKKDRDRLLDALEQAYADSLIVRPDGDPRGLAHRKRLRSLIKILESSS